MSTALADTIARWDAAISGPPMGRAGFVTDNPSSAVIASRC